MRLFLAFAILLSGRAARAQPKVPGEIRVGATVAVSGPFSGECGAFKKLMETWARAVNASGGVFMKEYGKKLPLRLFIYDDKSVPAEAVRLYEKLVGEDQVDVLLGPYSSPITMEASKVAEKSLIPMIGLEANAAPIFQRGLKWFVGVLDDGSRWSQAYFEMLWRERKAKTIGFVIEDTPHPREVGTGSIVLAKANGMSVVAEERFAPDTKDFGPIIEKLRAADPDIVYVSAFLPREIAFFKQAQSRLSPREFHAIHWSAAFRRAVGPEISERLSGEVWWSPSIKRGSSPKAAEFEDLLEKTGITIEDYPDSAVHFFGLDALKTALENAGTLDREKLLEAIKRLHFRTISGQLFFDPATGRGALSPVAGQIQDGRQVTVWPEPFATASHSYPRKPPAFR